MENFSEALGHLENGGVIIYPSESCYSFGCDAKNKAAVEKVHEIKEEGKDKSFILNVASLDQIREFGIVNAFARRLFEYFKGRGLTLIIEKRDGFEYLSKNGIAFRVLNNEVANRLANDFGAIITTSVNIHGEKPLYDIKSVREQFEGKTGCILDSGDLNENTKVSTLVDTRNMKILREGAVSKAEIDEFLNNQSVQGKT